MASDDVLVELKDLAEEKFRQASLRDVALLVRVVIEEALYVGLMIDLWLVSGKVRVYEVGSTSTKTWLAIQREIMADCLNALVLMANQEIPFTGIRPLEWAAALLESWEGALRTTEDVGKIAFYTRIHSYMRVIMVLMVPGMLRVGLRLTRQIVQLVG